MMAQILKLEGVRFVTCFPPNQLINASARAGIRTILARQERVVVNIADGYTRVSRQPGVALVAAGVGVENAFSGISQAFADLVPMLIVADQLPRRSLGARRTQDLDAVFALHKVTKWAERIDPADRVPELMRRAFTYLRTGRPGPIFLELPLDVGREEVDESGFTYQPIAGWRAEGNPRDVEVAARALLAAKSPLIYAGEGVYYSGGWEELRDFAELVQAPVMTTLKGKGIYPEDHPLSVGHGGMTGSKVAAHFLRRADLVFAIGASLTPGSGIFMGAEIPSGKTIVQCTVDELDLAKDYAVDWAIVGDAKLVLAQLIREVERQGGGKPNTDQALVDEISRVKEEWLREWMPKLTSGEVPIDPLRVVWDLAQAIDKRNTIVTHDSGCPRDHLAPFYEAVTPRGYLGWGHHSTLGYSLGGAMGAKLAQPEKTVINVMGDGAFGMVGMDFETAVREKIPILTVVLNNSGMGTYFEMTPSTSALSGNYAKVAEGLGGRSERVEEPDEVIPAIRRAQKSAESGRAALLEIITKVELGFQTPYWQDLHRE